MGALGWVQIFAYAGLCELTGPRTRAASLEDYAGITPGDYGWKVLSSNDPEELRKKLAAEVANSRLAMVAILGMFFQDGVTGHSTLIRRFDDPVSFGIHTGEMQAKKIKRGTRHGKLLVQFFYAEYNCNDAIHGF